MNFSAKGSKKCLVSWKSTKNHRFGQNLQLFEQTTMFWHFDELFRKKMQKVARFVKKHEHSWIWAKLATSRINYHVLAFRWLLQEKVAKRWKKWLISWKMTKNHRFGEKFQLFEETTMSWHFIELFSKKLQKAPHSVEKHEKSSIWPKLCNFSSKLPCFGISMKFSAKSYKKCPISWKSTKNRRFGENSQLFQQTTMFWRFGELFSEKLQKVPRFLRKL